MGVRSTEAKLVPRKEMEAPTVVAEFTGETCVIAGPEKVNTDAPDVPTSAEIVI